MTNNDITNPSLLVSEEGEPWLFTIARQNDPANTPLFDARDRLHPFADEADRARGTGPDSDPELWDFRAAGSSTTPMSGSGLLERHHDQMRHERLTSDAGDDADRCSRIDPPPRAGDSCAADPQDRDPELDAAVLLLLGMSADASRTTSSAGRRRAPCWWE